MQMVLLVCSALLLAGSTPAEAQSLTLSARTIYHAYQIPLWPGQDIGNRNLNRFYQTLDVGGWSLGPGGQVDAVVSMRYDTDFGTGFRVDTPMQAGIPATDGRNDIDLMYAYVDWRNIVKGRLHARIGRQVLIDDLAWYSMDGVHLRLTPWRSGTSGVEVQLYAGLPVRFDVVFSSEPFLNDGAQVNDERSFPHGVVFGGSTRLQLLRDLHLSVSYRQELSFRADTLEVFGNGVAADAEASAGSIGLQESRLGLSAGYALNDLGVDLHGSMIWDALVGALEQARAGVGYRPMAGVHAHVEYMRVRPRFAGDSIFNWFNIFGYDRGRAEVSVELIKGLTVQGGYLLQVFGGGPTARAGETFAGSDLHHGPSLGATYRNPRFGVGVQGEVATNVGGEYAYGGNYRMGWAFADVAFFDRRFVADTRVSVTSVQSDWFNGLDAGDVAPVDTSVMVSLGGRAQITDFLSTRLMFVKNFNATLEGGYRLYSELAVNY